MGEAAVASDQLIETLRAQDHGSQWWVHALIARIEAAEDTVRDLARAIKAAQPETVGYLRDSKQPGGATIPSEERDLVLALLRAGNLVRDLE